MKRRKSKTIYLLLAGMIFLVAYLRLSLRSVEIIAVHRDGDFSDVLIKNFLLIVKGKIKWWLENKEMPKNRCDVPTFASYGSYTISF